MKSVALLALLITESVSASALIYDGNGTLVGTYLGAESDGKEHGVSVHGYRFAFNRTTGAVLQPQGGPSGGPGSVFVEFTSTDCTGPAFLTATVSSTVPGAVFYGALPYEGGPPPSPMPTLYRYPQVRPMTQTVLIRSRYEYSSPENVRNCLLQNSSRTAIPIEENAPAETGVPSASFVPPLRVITQELFRDGFETLLATWWRGPDSQSMRQRSKHLLVSLSSYAAEPSQGDGQLGTFS